MSMTAAFETAMTDAEFKALQALIREEAGIHLEPVKRSLLIARLSRRLRVLGVGSFGEYCKRLHERDSEEKRHMIDAICTNETHFFRDLRQFDFFRSVVLPGMVRRCDPIRIWSAACSTGEEPYSLAMTALEVLGSPPGHPIEILASDLSSKALNAARAGIWPAKKAVEIPPSFLKRFMLQGVGSQEGMIAAGPEIRSLITFAPINLNHDFDPAAGHDVIFCRNVLIYFDRPTRLQVVHRLLRALRPGGYLFLGHAESLNGMDCDARSVGPNVYAVAAQGDRT